MSRHVSDARPWTVEVVELSGPSELDDWRADWTRLALDVDKGFFRSWEWSAAWMATFEPHSPLRLIVATDDESVIGLLPLVETRRPLHHRLPVGIPLTMIVGSGEGAADHVGCLATDPAVIGDLYGALAALTVRENLHLSHLDPVDTAAAARALAGRGSFTELTPTPWLDLAGASTLENLWPKKMTKEVRRRERRMEEAGVGRWWSKLTPELSGRLDDLKRLHTERWQSKGGAGLFGDDRVRLFTRLAALCADQPDQGAWLQVLEGADGPIGMQMGLRFGSRYGIIKSGWVPAAKALAPGQLLHAGGIEWALAHGVSRYDFLRGAEPYKYRLGAVDEMAGSLLRPRRISGWALQARNEVERWVEERDARKRQDDGLNRPDHTPGSSG